MSHPSLLAMISDLKEAGTSQTEILFAQEQAFTKNTGTDGTLVFIGDCHGQAGPLACLLDAVLKRDPLAKAVFTGDLIDRGPQSPECLRLAISASVLTGGTFLPGNHEQMMLASMWSSKELMGMSASRREYIKALAASFVMNGGSWAYSLPDNQDFFNPTTWLDDILPKSVMDIIHKTHRNVRDWLLSLPICARFADILAVHGGIPEEIDSIEDMESFRLFDGNDEGPLWVRDGFLERTRAFPSEVFVIHGHTPDTRHLDYIRSDNIYRPQEHRLCIDALSFGRGTRTLAAAILKPGSLQMAYALATP
ncbi:metallophosphoesterase family protein [Acetobacter persici]|nr:metallophosphoesterase family protein [Acetobacter persici]